MVQWGDDLHQISAGGSGPAIVTALWYGYLNTAGSTTHVIKIYDMVPPSVVPSMTSTVEKSSLLASIVLSNQPAGTFLVTVTGLDVLLPHSSVWIKFDEAGPGFPGTYWLTGGNPGIGYSHPGITQTVKDPGGGASNLWIPYDYFYVYVPPPFGNYVPVAANITVGLNGYHVPAPATIGLLGFGGLLALRRRRRSGTAPARRHLTRPHFSS